MRLPAGPPPQQAQPFAAHIDSMPTAPSGRQHGATCPGSGCSETATATSTANCSQGDSETVRCGEDCPQGRAVPAVAVPRTIRPSCFLGTATANHWLPERPSSLAVLTASLSPCRCSSLVPHSASERAGGVQRSAPSFLREALCRFALVLEALGLLVADRDAAAMEERSLRDGRRAVRRGARPARPDRPDRRRPVQRARDRPGLQVGEGRALRS